MTAHRDVDLGTAVALLGAARENREDVAAEIIGESAAADRLEVLAWLLARLAGVGMEKWDAADPGAATAWLEGLALKAAQREADER